MPTLVRPTSRLYATWLESREEWGRGAHQSNSGFTAEDDVDTAAGFGAWVQRLLDGGDETTVPRPGRVHATTWWITEADEYIGSIQLRHHLTDELLIAGGHVGYGIRPSRRRRGYATWALGAVKEEARQRGMPRLLLTCDQDNVGSARAIEANGGVLEDVRVTPSGTMRRYWINL